MCLSQPALKVRLPASGKRDRDEWTWGVNVVRAAVTLWAERTCDAAGGAAQDAREVFCARLFLLFFFSV